MVWIFIATKFASSSSTFLFFLQNWSRRCDFLPHLDAHTFFSYKRPKFRDGISIKKNIPEAASYGAFHRLCFSGEYDGSLGRFQNDRLRDWVVWLIMKFVR